MYLSILFYCIYSILFYLSIVSDLFYPSIWPAIDRSIDLYLLSIYLSMYLCVYLSVLSIYLSTYLPIYISIYLSVCLSLSICLAASLKTKLYCETSSFFEVDNIKNEAMLRDFFIFWTGQHPKRSNSARLLQFLNLTTSKTKEFCETSFKNGKLSAALTASYQCVLGFFHSTCLKYCACHEKLMPGHTKCCTCHAKTS